jgi:ArsR family transcriptional regulator, arsenate/arsenite/antimonite-responsive transcriptional repressor
MEKTAALAALGALAQESRLDIYRLLVQAGPDGMPAGHIGEQLGLPSATLAFHLKELKNAGLASSTRHGRSLIYAAEYPTMNALLFFLTENCCGRPSNQCLPLCEPDASTKAAPCAKGSAWTMPDQLFEAAQVKEMARARYGGIAAGATADCCAPAASSCCGSMPSVEGKAREMGYPVSLTERNTSITSKWSSWHLT